MAATHSHAFAKESMERTARFNMRWYNKNLMRVLQRAKENHAREADATIAIGEKLVQFLGEKVPLPVEVPLREVHHSEDDSLMKPIEQRVLDILYKGTEKGCDVDYLKERNKKSPEEKFYFRIVSSWDYGWQQKESRVPARDVCYPKCALLKQTFYRKNNVGPDPPHYAQPSGGEVSICSQYECSAN